MDGSASSDRAVMHVVGLRSTGAALRVLLLNVQPQWAPELSEEDARVGDAAEHIVKLARTQRCSHIVLGRRGRSAMARVVLGSVSMKVLQLADRPVTLVK